MKLEVITKGLEELKAKEIKDLFQPMLSKMVELEEQANEVFARKQSKKRSTDAKKLRMQLVKVRTGTAKIHKGAKAYHLLATRALDGFKSSQAFAGHSLEDKLKQIEDHDKIQEEQRLLEVERQDKAANEAKDQEIADLRKQLAAATAPAPVKKEAVAPAPVVETPPMETPRVIKPEPVLADEDLWVELLDTITSVKRDFKFKDDKNIKLHKNVSKLVDKVVTYINEKA